MTAARFTTRPVGADAMQWTGDNTADLHAVFGHDAVTGPIGANLDMLGLLAARPRRRVHAGDWVVRTDTGTFTSFTDPEFRAAYIPNVGAWCNRCPRPVDLDRDDSLIDVVEGGRLHAECEAVTVPGKAAGT